MAGGGVGLWVGGGTAQKHTIMAPVTSPQVCDSDKIHDGELTAVALPTKPFSGHPNLVQSRQLFPTPPSLNVPLHQILLGYSKGMTPAVLREFVRVLGNVNESITTNPVVRLLIGVFAGPLGRKLPRFVIG